VNIPYRDQSRLPNFDSAPADFNFAQIFTENRFVGQDRIGDANQVTTALVSRYLENDGSERLKLAVGQRFYFNHQRVTLDNAPSPSRSDLLLAATGRWSSTLSGDLAFQLSQSNRRAIQTSYSVQWQPEAKKVLNLGYRFQRDSLEQVDISGQWPLANRLYGVGGLITR
jgi:LPS-assembly protein